MAFGRWLPAAILSGAALCCLAWAPAKAAALTPVPSTVSAGNPVTITLTDDIAADSGVSDVDLMITFDPSLLHFESVANGSLLVGWGSPYFNPANGLLSISECGDTTCGSDAEGMGSIVSLTFTALAADPTTMTPVSAQSIDTAAGVSGEYQLARISTNLNITAASVTPPTTVPEPGTVALLLAPLLAVTGLTRRNRC